MITGCGVGCRADPDSGAQVELGGQDAVCFFPPEILQAPKRKEKKNLWRKKLGRFAGRSAPGLEPRRPVGADQLHPSFRRLQGGAQEFACGSVSWSLRPTQTSCFDTSEHFGGAFSLRGHTRQCT